MFITTRKECVFDMSLKFPYNERKEIKETPGILK